MLTKNAFLGKVRALKDYFFEFYSKRLQYAHGHLVWGGCLLGIHVMEAHGIKLSDLKTTSLPARHSVQGKDMMHNGISYIREYMYTYQ